MSTIKVSKPDQLKHENRTWSRLLDFFKQENAYLKNRLAEVVDHNIDKDFLAKAEQFQNKFILKDQLIDELRHTVNRQNQAINDNGTNVTGNKLQVLHGKMRIAIEQLEKDFAALKYEFNDYLSKA